MQPSEARLALQEEVEELQQRLDGQLTLNNVLRSWALNPTLLSAQSHIPLQAQVLLTELETVEAEIMWLDRKVGMLKRSLRQMRQLQHNSSLFDLEVDVKSPTTLSFTSPTPLLAHRSSPAAFNEEMLDRSRRNTQSIRNSSNIDYNPEDPNRISEELVRSLISIFLKMSRTSELEVGAGSGATKHTFSCISSRSFTTKTSFTCKARPSITIQTVDPWDTAAYKGYAHITRSSFSKGIFDCNTIMSRTRALLQKLCDVDLAFLNYKQKLAFWINVYNACIMNAYIQHGLPSTLERMLSLMNKAVVNVGGIVLNALAIEHYILRHPHDTKQDAADEKEILLRRAYGLRYPEPNVTFALCRGNWSSPVLRVYSPEEVVNELERAKVEYLEGSVGVRSKKKIVVPKLVQWHMHDFADDLESLIEWIYSQLPPSGMLKKRIMECLNAESNPPRNVVEILPYQYEFRYIIASTTLHKGYQ